jgi:hypothetical protein
MSIYLYRWDGSPRFRDCAKPAHVAHRLAIPKERMFGLVPSGPRNMPALCPYTLRTAVNTGLPLMFQNAYMENVWQFCKVMPHITKHTQMLNRRGVWKNSTPLDIFKDDVQVDNITGNDWVDDAPNVVKDMLISDDPIRSYVPKKIRRFCMGSANPYDLNAKLLDYVSARMSIYGRLYIESVLANPKGNELVQSMKAMLARGEDILLYETDGPTETMLHSEPLGEMGPVIKATTDNIKYTVQTHTQEPVGHCFFLSAHLLGVQFDTTLPSTVRSVSVQQVRSEIKSALSLKRAR